SEVGTPSTELYAGHFSVALQEANPKTITIKPMKRKEDFLLFIGLSYTPLFNCGNLGGRF
ncbi:MAG: hypothetical protein AAF193_01195, partial [Bacteroidota bacterium]